MSPEERAVINKQNASQSTGAITASGKATVSANATRHGLSGKSHAVLKGEEDAFAEHLAGFRKAYNPRTTPEESLVKTLAQDFWRLDRAHRMETAAFDRAFAEALEESPDAIEPLVHAAALNDPQTNLRNIVTYAARIQRAIEKTTAQLKSLQDERKAAYAKAEEEAMLLTELANAHKNISQAAAYFNEGAANCVANSPAPSPAPASAPTDPSGPDPRPQTPDPASASGLSVVHPELGGFVYSFDEIRKKIIRRNRIAEARARFAPAPDINALLKGAIG